MSIASVLGTLQKDIEETESRITTGTVESINPLQIRKDKLLITESYIILSPAVEFIGLEIGQRVVLLQANRQQTYYVLEILETSVREEVDETLEEVDGKIEAAKYIHPTTSGNKHIPSGGSANDLLGFDSDGTAKWLSPTDTRTALNVEDGANNYAHPTTPGSNHIPNGGEEGQILGYSSDGVAEWIEESKYEHPTTNGYKHIPSGGSKGQILQYHSEGTASWVSRVANLQQRNNFYRGDSLGTSISSEQNSAMIRGQFTDMYIGDYWTIGGRVYRIAGFDYFRGRGSLSTTTDVNRIVLVPDKGITVAAMHPSNSTAGGIYGSSIYSTLGGSLSIIQSAFGSSQLKNVVEYMSNATSGGAASGGIWVENRSSLLMNEAMVFGSSILGNIASTNVATHPNLGVATTQLPLFRLNPELIAPQGDDTAYGLRDISSASSYVAVDKTGAPTAWPASNQVSVRPAIVIGWKVNY